MRLTMRSGRTGSTKHNDRSFLDGRDAKEIAPHINLEKTEENVYAYGRKDMSMEEYERHFYEKRYSESCNARNENYIKYGHPERCKTPSDLYEGRLTRPEEMILQIGDLNEHVSEEKFRECVADYIQEFEQWNKSHGNHGHLLSVAIHVDEATPHAHIRRVWDYEQNGIICLGQNKGLEQAGVPLPDPNSKPSRYNNRKMTFDVEFREKWIDICRSKGLQIETEPRPNMKHLEKVDYINQKLNTGILERQNELVRLNEEITSKKEVLERAATIEQQAKSIEKRERALEPKKHYSMDDISAKRTLHHGERIISEKDLQNLIHKANCFEEAHKTLLEADQIRSEAHNEATAMIKDAESEVDFLKEKLASIRLEEVQELHPDLFDARGNLIKTHQRDIGSELSEELEVDR